MQSWSLLLAGLLLADAVLLPLQLAFGPDAPGGGWRPLVEVLLWADIGLQFFVQIESRDAWISDFRPIALEYLRHGFVVDVASVAQLTPLLLSGSLVHDSLALLGEDRRADVCYTALLGFHKLLRFFRVPRVMRLMEARDSVIFLPTQLTHSKATLLKSLAAVVFTVHVMACLWSTTAVCGAKEYCWFEYYRREKPGPDSLYANGNSRSIYMCSLYWAIFTLTGIGYGDIVPVSPLEYVVATVCMFCASLTWAWVVANIVSIIAMMGESQTTHMLTLDCVNEVTRDMMVHESRLAQRLREYFTKLQNVRDDSFVDKLIDRLSPELKLEMVFAVHGHWLEQVWWMKMVPNESEFMVDLTRSMEANLHTPNEMIPNRAQLAIIRQGLCIHGGKLLSKGCVFGEDMLLDNDALRRPWATLALTYLHIMVLQKRTFKSVLAEHPDAQPHIRKAHVFLVVMRGIQKKAESLKRERQKKTGQFGIRNSDTVLGNFKVTQDLGSTEAKVILNDPGSPLSPQASMSMLAVPSIDFAAAGAAGAVGAAGGGPQTSTAGEAYEEAAASLLGRVSDAETSLLARMESLEKVAADLVAQARRLSAE